jgi:hypothetical protein
MMLKRLAMTMAFICSAALAQAATLNTVVPVAGGPTLSDGMGITNAGSAGVSYLGSPSGISSSLAENVLLTATFGGLPDTFIATGAISGTELLIGTILDFDDGPGTITALFSTSEGTLAAEFGSLFQLTLSDSLFSDTTLDSLVPAFSSATSAQVTAVAIIPLPAGVWLMLSGLGGLLYLGRRRRA